jgi:hypothetical protein
MAYCRIKTTQSDSDTGKINNKMPTTMNKEILAAAIEGLEIQKQQITAQIAELRQQLAGGSVQAQATPKSAGKRRKMSAAARERIAEAQRKRWAAVKKQTVASPQAAKTQKPKRRLSAEGRRRIIEATKKRWAKVRAAAAKAGKKH